MASRLTLLLITALSLQNSAAAVTDTTTTTQPPRTPGLTEPATAPLSPATENGAMLTFKAHFVAKEQRAPVAYESPKGGIFFKANVAGRDVWAMLDTGAHHSLVDIAWARSAGLSISSEEEKIRSSTGEMAMHWTQDVAILIPGQIEVRHPRLGAIDLGMLSTIIDRKIEFILGQDLLSHVVLLVDPAKHIFQLGPSGSFKAPPQAWSIDLQNQKPQIEVTIGKEKVLLGLNTGSNSQVELSAGTWARVLPRDVATGTTISAAPTGAAYAKRSALIPELGIGALKIPDVTVTEAPSRSRDDSYIGTGILGRFRLALDLNAGKLWLGSLPPPGAVNGASAEKPATSATAPSQ
ncbi:MAG TPA: retropepsin-like aspartic protease [Povalibacter sp.]|nr:retropepsin-like aspartic protease [Povalibacter sp.]